MNKKKLFLSDVLSHGFKAMINNIGYMFLVEITYYCCLLIPFLFFLPAIPILILLQMNVHNKIASIAQEYHAMQANSSLEQITQSMAIIKKTMGIIPVWFIALIFLFVVCFFMFWSGLALGYRKIILNLYDGKPAPLRLLLSSMRYAPNFFVACLLTTLMLAVGAFFFIIPGLIVMVLFGLFSFFMVDKNVGPIESLKLSYQATVRQLGNFFLCLFVLCFSLSLGQKIIQFLFMSYMPSLVFFAQIFYNTLAYLFVMFCYACIYRTLSDTEVEDGVAAHIVGK